MKVELTAESVDKLMRAELSQQLKWALEDLANLDKGVTVNMYTYNDPEGDKVEILKDIEAFERIMSYWKVP
jgi:hypothetical protein|tara:strand:+ start:3003 stop:3215 length:213 start_codon:yes stop_codon:yes gene_type:complete